MNKQYVHITFAIVCILVLTFFNGCSSKSMLPKEGSITFAPINDTTDTSHITARIFYPLDTPEPYPVVIDMHGCSGIIEVRMFDWVARLNRWGYAVIKPDSFNPRGDDNICDDLLKVSPLHRLADLAGAIDYVRTNARLDYSNIFAMGMSHGATTVLLANYKPQHNFDYIKGIIAYYPYCIEALHALVADTLILIGEEDDWTPAKYCRKMAVIDKAGHTYETVFYPDAVHSFDVPQRDMIYLGHRLEYNRQAAQDSIVKVNEFLRQRTERN